MMEIGFHTDAFNSSYWSFEQCLEWAQRHNVHWIECGAIDGVSWMHGLGYYPHVALWQDPVLLRSRMANYEVAFSQIDAAFPLSTPEGASIGLEYVLHTIRWAAEAGCPCVDTTDDRYPPAHLTDREAIEQLRRIYQRILPVAEAHRVTVNVEPHGYYTTKPEFLDEILHFSDSPYLRLNLDVGNIFIAGHDPVAFSERFLDRVNHVHLKDISPSLEAEARGEQTGVAGSQCALGEGVNAGNLRQCVRMLVEGGYPGVFTIECEAYGGPLLERSLEWVRDLLGEVEAHSEDLSA
jgi:sugar phosphate isomerase/epimerase